MNMVKIGEYYYINMDNINYVDIDHQNKNALNIYFTNGNIKHFYGEQGKQLISYLEHAKLNIYKGK